MPLGCHLQCRFFGCHPMCGCRILAFSRKGRRRLFGSCDSWGRILSAVRRKELNKIRCGEMLEVYILPWFVHLVAIINYGFYSNSCSACQLC